MDGRVRKRIVKGQSYSTLLSFFAQPNKYNIKFAHKEFTSKLFIHSEIYYIPLEVHYTPFQPTQLFSQHLPLSN